MWRTVRALLPQGGPRREAVTEQGLSSVAAGEENNLIRPNHHSLHGSQWAQPARTGYLKRGNRCPKMFRLSPKRPLFQLH